MFIKSNKISMFKFFYKYECIIVICMELYKAYYYITYGWFKYVTMF